MANQFINQLNISTQRFHLSLDARCPSRKLGAIYGGVCGQSQHLHFVPVLSERQLTGNSLSTFELYGPITHLCYSSRVRAYAYDKLPVHEVAGVDG